MKSVTSALGDARDQLASRLPIPGRTPKATRARKVGKAGLGVLAVSALFGAGFAITRKRFVTGSSVVTQTTELDDGRLLVSLEDGTTLVVATSGAEQAKTIATTGAMVDYRVNRVSIGGIPAGTVSVDTRI